MQELVQLTRVFSRRFSMSFQSLKIMQMASKSFWKNSSKLNKFLHSEVNILIQHIIVQDQDRQNNNITQLVMESEASMPHSQGLSNNLYPELNQTNFSY
jgi:hypothetical protein